MQGTGASEALGFTSKQASALWETFEAGKCDVPERGRWECGDEEMVGMWTNMGLGDV